MRASEVCDPRESEWDTKAWKTKTSYSSNPPKWMSGTWSESRGKHGIVLDGEDWYDVKHGRLIITPDRTAKEREISRT